MSLDDSDGASGPELVGERVRIFRRGRMWYANFQAGGKQHRPSLQTTSKKQARVKAMALETELAKGTWKATPAAVAVADGIAAYLAYLKSEDRAAKTLTKYTAVLKRVQELATARRVKDLAGLDLRFVDAFRQLRTDQKAAAKTRYTETNIIRQFVNFALSRDLLAVDPLKGLKLKKPKPTPQPCWTYEQVLAILTAAPPAIRPALTLLAHTGMRFGELAWLRWEDVEPTVLRVQPKQGWKPKSGDQRAIPRNPVIDAVLADLPRRYGWVVTMPPTTRHPQHGRQWTERRLLAALKRTLKPLKLLGKLHTFRHSFISNALIKGVPVAVVKEWVGHVDDTVLKLYTHVHDLASQAAMRALTEANREQAGEMNRTNAAGGGSAQIQPSDQEAKSDVEEK